MTEAKPKSRPVAIYVIVALLVILAILGFASGLTFLSDPSGGAHDMDTSILEGTPVGDYTLVGLLFVTAYGILPILAVFGLLRLPRWRWTDLVNKWTGQNWAWTATAAIGVILILWIAVEVFFIGSPDGFPRFLQVMMTLLGVVFLGLTMLPRVRTFTRLSG